jgi:GAF domain-containing protein
MKSLYTKLSITVAIFFLIGIVGVTYYLYRTPADIAHVLQIREMSQIQLLEKALKPVSVAIGVEFFLGVTAILFLLLSRQHAVTNNKEEIRNSFSAQTDVFTDIADTVCIDKRVEVIQSKLQATYPDVRTKLEKVLACICNEVEACQGAIFQARSADNKRFVEMCASYAYFIAESRSVSYEFGEGLTGQVAKEGKSINISTVPEGYVTIISGLGNASPKHLIIAPVRAENVVVGVLEIASFKSFTKADEDFLNELSPLLGQLLAVQHQEEAII